MIRALFLTKDNKIDMRAIAALACVALATLGIDPISLQSWQSVGTLIWDAITNPYKLTLIAGAVYGWARNNRTEVADENL